MAALVAAAVEGARHFVICPVATARTLPLAAECECECECDTPRYGRRRAMTTGDRAGAGAGAVS